MMGRRFILALPALFGTASLAQPMDDAWRDMYGQLECVSLAAHAFWDDGKQADLHLNAARAILAGNPGLFSGKIPAFIQNKPGADGFGLPAGPGEHPQAVLDRVLTVISGETRLRIVGPPPEYPKGMTVSPSAENGAMNSRQYAREYEQHNCTGMLND